MRVVVRPFSIVLLLALALAAPLGFAERPALGAGKRLLGCGAALAIASRYYAGAPFRWLNESEPEADAALRMKVAEYLGPVAKARYDAVYESNASTAETRAFFAYLAKVEPSRGMTPRRLRRVSALVEYFGGVKFWSVVYRRGPDVRVEATLNDGRRLVVESRLRLDLQAQVDTRELAVLLNTPRNASLEAMVASALGGTYPVQVFTDYVESLLYRMMRPDRQTAFEIFDGKTLEFWLVLRNGVYEQGDVPRRR